MTTKKKIAEEVSRIYSRFVDRENVKPVLEPREAMVYVEQAINEIFRPEILRSFKEGVLDVPESHITHYDSITVETDDSGAYIELPAHPIYLPNDMGVWRVFKKGDYGTTYIPIPKAYQSLMGDTIIKDLEQKTGWWRVGGKVRFTNDITLSAYGSVSEISLELVTTDFSTLTELDVLPINSNYEAQVVERALQLVSNGQFALNEVQIEDNVE